MRDFLKRIVAIFLSAAMVLTGLPAMGVAKKDVLADEWVEEAFDPTLEYFNKKASEVDGSSTDKIYWVIADGSNSLATGENVIASGVIENIKIKTMTYTSPNYGTGEYTVWWVNLSDEIAGLTDYLNGVQSSYNTDGRHHKLFYELQNSSGNYSWYNNTIKDWDNVKSMQYEYYTRSAGLHGDPRDYTDTNRHFFEVTSARDGGWTIEKIGVALHVVENYQGSAKCINATYYSQVAPTPETYSDQPNWVWSYNSSTNPEYIEKAKATFVSNKTKEGFNYNIEKDATIVPTIASNDETTFKATANFSNTKVAEKCDSSGNVYSTKVFNATAWPSESTWGFPGNTSSASSNTGLSGTASFTLKEFTPPDDVEVSGGVEISRIPYVTGFQDEANRTETYNRNVTFTAAKNSSDVTTVTATANFGGNHTTTKTFNKPTWTWADDYSWADAKFVAQDNANESYTVRVTGSGIQLTNEKYVATAYFCGLEFTSDPKDASVEITAKSWDWEEVKNDAGEVVDFKAIVTPQKSVGGGTPVEMTPVEANKYTRGTVSNLTLDAEATVTDGSKTVTLKTADSGDTLNFNAPTWDWKQSGYTGDFMTANATFTFKSPTDPTKYNLKSSYTVPAYEVTHDKPVRQSDGTYNFGHHAKAEFCQVKPFTVDHTETDVIPDIIDIKKETDESQGLLNGWVWSPYDKDTKKIAATANFMEQISRWNQVVEETFSGTTGEKLAEKILYETYKDNTIPTSTICADTHLDNTGDNGRVRFQGVVTYRGVEKRSDIRVFTCADADKVWTGYTSCKFTVRESGGLGETVELTATAEKDGGLELDETTHKYKQKYKASVPFSRINYTSSKTDPDVDPNSKTEWVWGTYDPQTDTYPVRYWIKSTLTGETLDGGTAGIEGLLKAEKKADGSILLTAYDADEKSPKGYKVTPDTRTVKAPPTWDWNTTDANKNMTVTATFEQIGGGSEWNRKMIPFDSADDPYKHVKLTHDTPVPRATEPGKYDWNHHATVTFCGLEYESGDNTEIVIPMPSVIPPPPTVTPTPGPGPDPQPTPIPNIELFEDKEAYGGTDNWYWNKYKENEQEIPAFALVADWIDRWSSLEPDNTERNYLTPRVLSDDETALAQNSAGVKSDGKKKDSTGGNRVYFQGEVVANRYNDNGKEVEQKLSSQEREFNCSNNTAWNADKTDITFTFTETPAYRLKDSAKDTKVQLTASAMAALGDDHGGFEYGPYQPDDKNAGKLKRSVWAYVYFGHQQFWSSEATQDNIDPDSIEVAWKWNKYDRALDRYTAEYEVTALKENEKGVTERIVMPKESALNPVVAVATKVAEDSGVLLTANLPSTSIYKKYEKLNKLVEKDKTKNAYGPNWAWETKNDTKKYLEATATFTDDLSSTIAPYTLTSDTPARMTITHDTPVFNESTKKYDWQHYATVTFCGLEFKASQQSGWEVDITPTPIVVTPTPGGSMDSKKKADDNWYWDSYKEVEQEIPATVKVAYTIDRWKVAKPAEVTSEALEPMAVETDNETALTKESGVGGIDKEGKGNNKVVFQGEVETIDSEKKLLSKKRTFTNTDRSGWNTEATECVFTFTESSTGYTLRETVKVTANAANEALGIAGFEYGPLVPDPKSGREGLFKRSIWAYVDFGHQRFWSTEGEQTGIPGDYEIEWNWHSYDPDADSYTVDYKVYLLKAAEHTIAPTRVELTDERGSVEAVATKDKDGNITLTASVPTSKKYSSSKDNPSVRKVAAPVWNWSKDFTKAPATFVEDATAFAEEHARTDWGETSHVKNPAKIDTSKYRIKSLDPELYERTHSAEVTFCKLNFDSEKDQEIKPSFDIPKVTATPTPVPSTPGDGTPTPTPTPKPGEPTPTPKPDTYTTNTVSWTWADYKERLNNTSATDTPNKGNFESATATLTDDQTGFFTKRITAVGTKSGVGGITIDPTGTENPATKTFTAKVENKKTDGTTEQLSDLLTFKKPAASDWTWTGVESATVKFKEASGKKTFGHLKDTVEITTDDIEKEYNGVGANGQAEFVYTATAYFGESPYTSAVNNSLTDPGLVIKWIWKGYDERNDQYVADYEITSTKIDNYSETGTVYMKKANNNAEKLSNGVTKLTAKATSANYPTISFEDIRNVKAPAWAWTTDYEKATASFKESEDDWKTPETPSTITKVDNTIVHGPYIVEKDTPTEKYYMRDHEASVVFCGNEFPVTETQHKIIPTYDIPKVTVTPTPTLPPGVTATPTPTLKPGTTATPTPYSKHTVSWTWDDYKERLNNTSANETPNKGNFEKATAILTDDQTGYFTKELVADGKKTGTGGITITTPATNSSPISFKAAVENVKSNGTKEALNDTLSFGYPKKADWDWAGVTSATVTFKESKGKTFGKDNESTVAITTKDIEHVADLTKTVYTATAYFGTHPYTDVLEVNTDYVVYLRWPSSWNTAQYDPDYQYNKRKNPFKVYCYVYDDNGNDNGTTMSDKGVEVKGELMDVVVKGRTGRFFNYPLAAGSFENPSVKFYNALGVELPTPDVQSIVGDKVTDVGTKLTMTEKGDWLYYEAALETASAKNTWKKYLPEINGHALTVVDSGILGMDFYFDIPERYGSSGTVVISAREEEGHPSRFTYNSQSRLSDGRFLFSRDVLIARIANDIYVDLTYGSGANMAHLTETYSVEKYLTTGIERADAGLPQYQKVANVLRTINDYGWYAQMALNMDANEDPTPLTKCYGAPALMSIEEATKLLEPYKFVVEKQAGDVTGFKYPLACWEDARINLYTYTPDKTVQAEVIDREAQAEGFEFEPALIDNKYQTKGGRYMYTLLGIPLDSLDKWFRFRITTDGGESIVKVSALSNQYRNIADTTGEVSQDSKNLSLAIVNVWKELNAFFES